MAEGNETFRAMRILLLAHDYPPIDSPQALRWGYLARELHRMGHQVTVFCATPPGRPQAACGWAAGPVVIPVPASGLLHNSFRMAARSRRSASRVTTLSGTQASIGTSTWRGRVAANLFRAADWFVFPDGRRAWLRPAKKAVREWLRNNKPDVVISSHEPAVSLLLGEECARRGLTWVVDLGDPILTDYTLPHWRRAALRLESRVCRRADALITTSAATSQLLAERHQIDAEKFTVVPQGFEPSFDNGRKECGGAELQLLYTGRFYRFRSGRELFEAVVRTPGVVLDIATPEVSSELRAYASKHPRAIRIQQSLPHEDALEAQRHADVLVCLGNANPVQTPGKVYEYLGSGRPLLQVYQKASDPVNALVTQLRRGWTLAADVDALSAKLVLLRDMKAAGRLLEGLDLSMASVTSHNWKARALVLADVCSKAIHGSTTHHNSSQAWGSLS